MFFFRQLIIPGRQPLDKALDLQQRQRGQYAPGGQLRFVDHPVDRLLSALQLPQNGGFVGRYARQNFLYVNISPVFLLVNGFCVSFFRIGRSFRHNKVVLRLLRAERHGAERPLAQGQIRVEIGIFL